MSWEAKPYNPNGRGISRSGNVSGFAGTDRHPSDGRSYAGVVVVVAVALVAMASGWGIWS